MRLGATPPTTATDTTKRDSLGLIATDSIQKIDTVDARFADSEINSIIDYKATDSIVYDLTNKKMYLYNGGDVSYDKTNLKADSIEFDWTTYTMSAGGVTDSDGHKKGTPIFSESGKEYRAGRMAYNFKSKKGKIFEVVSQEGEAFLHSAEVKRNEFEEWYGKNNKYTTCNLEHPHFYFQAKKIKVIPNKIIATGPTNLYIADIPTPLAVPFAIFPLKQGRRSGIIVPKPGSVNGVGFGIKEGGYFWAVNDYLSLKATFDVFTNGTFGANVGTQYRKNYKFNGNFGIGYYRTMPNDPDLPGAKAINAFSINWSHTQDPKSIPNASFSANVNMQTSNFYSASYTTDSRLLTTQFTSSVNYGKSFSGKLPGSVSVTLRHTQNLLTKTFDVEFPIFRLGLSRISPFKPKISTGTRKWYENIGFTYGLEAKAAVNTYDTLLTRFPEVKKALKYGVKQDITVDAPITLFKYLNINPSFSYTERTYFQSNNHTWVPDTVYGIGTDGKIDTIRGRLKTDTVNGFYGVRNFAASFSMNTKLTGIFNVNGKTLKGIRHIFTPQVSFSYSPDFSDAMWKSYQKVQTNANGEISNISRFLSNAVYGVPGQGKVAQLNFSLNNNFDVKVASKKDTITGTKNLGILERFNITGGYNFFAEKFKLQPFDFRGSSRILDNLSLNFGFQLDPYAVDSNNNKVQTYYFTETKRLLRFATADISLNANFQGKSKAVTNPTPSSTQLPKYVSDYAGYNPDDYYDFNIPWTVSINYNFNISRGLPSNPDTLVTSQAFRFAGDFNLTAKWKFALTSGFDVQQKKPTLTNVSVIRDLHCWELSFNWTAYPVQLQQFAIELKVRSSTLQDLKLTRKRTFLQSGF